MASLQHGGGEYGLERLRDLLSVQADEGLPRGEPLGEPVCLVSQGADEYGEGRDLVVLAEDLGEGLGGDAVAVEVGVREHDDEGLVVLVRHPALR